VWCGERNRRRTTSGLSRSIPATLKTLEVSRASAKLQRRKNSGEAPARIVFDPWADHVI
jgi:hypothetical protein